MLRAEGVAIDLLMYRGSDRINCLEKAKEWIDSLIRIEQEARKPKPKPKTVPVRNKGKVDLQRAIRKQENAWRLADRECEPHRAAIIAALEANDKLDDIAGRLAVNKRKLTVYVHKTLQLQWNFNKKRFLPIPMSTDMAMDILKEHEKRIRRWLLDGYRPNNIAKELGISEVAKVVMFVEKIGFRWDNDQRLWIPNQSTQE